MQKKRFLLTMLVIPIIFLYAVIGCETDDGVLQEIFEPEEIVETEAETEREVFDVEEVTEKVIAAESHNNKVVVNVDVLRLRSGPSTDHDILDRLMFGTILQVIRRANEWMQVITPDGKEGWVHSEYVAFQGPTNLEYGSISGRLGYPSCHLPSLRIAAFSLNDESVYYIDTESEQLYYQMDGLPPGDYHVVAYAADGYAGGYSQYVLDGLHRDDDAHTLLTVNVYPGKVTKDIDPGDWYAPDGAFPARP